MTFVDSISTCFSKYFTFSGRAQRSELWWFVLFVAVGGTIADSIDSISFGKNVLMLAGMEFSYNSGFIADLFGLATFLPLWAAEVRRLHDGGRSGWWLLLWFIPLIGAIILLIWMIGKGTDGDNEYGADPLA